ncbi:ATP-binding protein [Synechocystis salina]|uniref:AAA family ATPase n=1 Tax=Synechocystis salina LEGE 00031 TaxID=1828736 RepID=A0ABR9VRW2_9SYNC|nr:ATP-binding protein [Synechocystis salina]MBE9240143.1 AAA family ATPase [Synechocystis salina LEGE 00041]MBE9253653.1 AAA family ATPase [Synechocystis salina LEGE 00031]
MHILTLIGCPSSGKSTVANKILQENCDYQIVSTDKVRAKLFGDESIQGNWQELENEVFRQIKQHVNAGYSIIYDATNAKKAWRIELLQKLKQLGDIDVIGLYVKTPLEICQQWNQQRERKVPDFIIEDYHQTLKQFPPTPAEGFTTVIDVLYENGNLAYPKSLYATSKIKSGTGYGS